MKKIVIITGGRVSSDFIRETLLSYKPAVLIASDRGIMVLEELGLIPDYLVGDFDSGEHEVVEKYRSLFETEGRPIIKGFQPEKDETDTALAVSLALGLSPSEILILGGTGTRLDHTLANVGLLMQILERGVKGYLCDEYNLISLHDEDLSLAYRKCSYPFFSLLAFGGPVSDLRIQGAKYELDAYTLFPDDGLCVSNEFLGKKVNISFKEGRLLLFQTADNPVKKPLF